VGIDDACAFLARFHNGSLATFESTRYARGHKALYTFEINGENASIAWDLHDLHRLQYFDYRDEPALAPAWRSIHVSEGEHPYIKNWWVPACNSAYEHTFVHQVADFPRRPGEQETGGADVPRAAGRRRPSATRFSSRRALGVSRMWRKSDYPGGWDCSRASPNWRPKRSRKNPKSAGETA